MEEEPSDSLVFTPELIPEPPEPAFVDHLLEFFPVRVDFQASLADLVLLDFNIDSGQVAAEDQNADPIRSANGEFPPTTQEILADDA